jgi:hypothetical protein
MMLVDRKYMNDSNLTVRVDATSMCHVT